MSKNYTLIYPDKSKGNIKAQEKESLLLAGDIEQIDESTYKLVGGVILMHGFAELRKIRPRIVALLVRFFPGLFVREFAGKRIPEMLESPEAMALRLRLTA